MDKGRLVEEVTSSVTNVTASPQGEAGRLRRQKRVILSEVEHKFAKANLEGL